MIIGIPRERKTLEKRVALTPDGAHKLIEHGHKIIVENDAGLGAHFLNESYSEVGCQIVNTLEEVWKTAEMVVKVKEPAPEEFEYFRPGLVLFDYLHLASMPEVTRHLLDKQITGLAYELVQDRGGHLPLLEPMSEIAGKLSVLNGSYFMLSQHGGRGILPGGATGVERARVVIAGAGIAGRNACEYAVGLGAIVTILDINCSKLEDIKVRFGNQVTTLYSTPAALSRACADADLLVGAVLIPGAAAPKIITREIIKAMKNGAVFVDISIDQGGSAETIHTTSLEEPVYVEEGVVHYAVPNMPSQTARTSTMALTSATLPYVAQLADLGVEKALQTIPEIRGSLNTCNGKLTNKAVSEAVNIEYTPIGDVL